MNKLMNEGLNETETTSNAYRMIISLTSVSQLLFLFYILRQMQN